MAFLRALAAAALLLPSAAPAQDPVATDLLRRHLDHLGGRGALEAAGDLVYEGRIDEAGQSVRYRALVRRRPFGFRQEVYLPGTSEPAVVRIADGRHVWRPGPGGKGEPLAGAETRVVLEAAFFDGFRYLEPETFARRCEAGPESPLPAVPGMPATSGAAPARPIWFLTPGGGTVQAWFHRDDGRLLGLDAPWPFPAHGVRCENWREFGTLRLPAVRREGSPGMQGATIMIDELRTGAELPDRLFAGCPAQVLPASLDVAALEAAPYAVLAPGGLGARSEPASLPQVVEVAPGTAAAAAGIEVGDRLAALDGASCAGVEPGRFNERLWVREGQVGLEVVRRGGERRRVVLP
jgi:hypothetical protein